MTTQTRLIDIDYQRMFRRGFWSTITLRDQDVEAVAGEPLANPPEIGGGFDADNWMYSDQRGPNRGRHLDK
jgi:hypothetical protein